MTNTFQFYNGDKLVSSYVTKSLIFSGGEVMIQLANAPVTRLVARIQTSDDLIALAMVKDILDRAYQSVDLVIPYLPYARQDRVCNPGEAHSLKVVSNFINSLGFPRVKVLDVHSNVALGTIDRVENVEVQNILRRYNSFIDFLECSNSTLVSPDAGSNKKVYDVTKTLLNGEFVRCDKLRDLSTGQIKETIVYADDLSGRDCIVIDDICDGGRTFIEIAKALKKKNARSVHLYVTHGIFSQGLQPLYDGGIDHIWTTNSFDFNRDPLKAKTSHKLSVLNIETII